MTTPTSPTVDRVMADARAVSFTTRSIKTSAKLAGLRLALSMVDLTTLEGADSPEKVRALCAKAVRPMPDDEAVLGARLPSVAAVCVYPSMVAVAREALDGLQGDRLEAGATGVRIASVATGFPSGQFPIDVRLGDVREAVADGADEIDMVINRGAFLSGRYEEVADEIRRVVGAIEDAESERSEGSGTHLKVILETGELETYDNVRRASDLAIDNIRDGDFIKTSTGKVSPAATMGVSLVMLEAVRDAGKAQHADADAHRGVAPASSRSAQCHEGIGSPGTSLGSSSSREGTNIANGGRIIGFKPAGGIRTAKSALHYLCMVKETVGERWLTPELFRFGASSLVNDILRQLVKQKTGAYSAQYDFGEA